MHIQKHKIPSDIRNYIMALGKLKWYGKKFYVRDNPQLRSFTSIEVRIKLNDLMEVDGWMFQLFKVKSIP